MRGETKREQHMIRDALNLVRESAPAMRTDWRSAMHKLVLAAALALAWCWIQLGGTKDGDLEPEALDEDEEL